MNANGESKPLTCSTCRHWLQAPIDPRNLGAPRQGECRAMPPQLVVLGGDGRGNLAMQSLYPPVGQETPACGLHAPVQPKLVGT